MDKLTKRLIALPSDAITGLVARIDELKGQWVAGAMLSPQALGRLKKSTLVTSTGASTRIEGAQLSDEEIEKLMGGMKLMRFRDRDKQEVQGYYELLQNMFDTWQATRLSESTIKHFHKELLKYVDYDAPHRGNYKNTDNAVEMRDADGKVIAVLFKPTPAYLTPKEMQELVEWTNSAFEKNEHHPLLITGNFILEFLSIHPFQDGNGRLSRILTNLLLLKSGYAYVPYASHEKFIENNKTDYYLALRRSQKTLNSDKEDIIPWLTFFLGLLELHAQQAIRLLDHEGIEKLLSPAQSAVWKYIQQAGEATPRDISVHANVPRPTVNQALDKLLQLKRIERIGQGRATRYRKL